MSYCRTPVYAYASGDDNFHIHAIDKHYQLSSLQEFRDKLLELKESGLNIPDRVFNRIDEEMKGTKDG